MNTKNKLSYDNLITMAISTIPQNFYPTEKAAKRYYRALYKVILRQLEINQSIYIKDFGTFEVKERKSGERLINNPANNETYVTYVKPRISISFRPAEKFDFCVNEGNFKLISSASLKKNKRNKRKPYKLKYKKKATFVDLLNLANERKNGAKIR